MRHDTISIAHAKDRTTDFKPCAAEKGILDFDYYLRQLKQSGFGGPLIIRSRPVSKPKGGAPLREEGTAEPWSTSFSQDVTIDDLGD